MCLERRTSHVGGKQAAVRTEGQNSACVLFVFGVNFPWLPGLSAFCLWRLVSWLCWPFGRPWRLFPPSFFVGWSCRLALSSWVAFSGLIFHPVPERDQPRKSGLSVVVCSPEGATTQGPLFGQVSPLRQSFGILVYVAVFCSSLCRLSYFVRLSHSGAVVMCL